MWSPSVNDNSPTTRGAFTLSATVSNAGNGESMVTTLRYYWSTDGTIATSDTEVGTDAVGGLTASATSSESISLTAPSSGGTYYYGACVDAVADESNTTNNCSGSVEITVLEPVPQVQTAPDLRIYGGLVFSSPGPWGIVTIGLSVGVRNSGDGEAAATMLRYYQSTDATITTADTQVATAVVAGLAASATANTQVDLTPPSTPGTYYYGACVDAVTGESDTTNNCGGAIRVTIP